MNISDQLSGRIAELVDIYRTRADASPDLCELVAKENVLPLYCDMGGVLTIGINGEIRSFLWDDLLHGQIEDDPRIRNIALFQGSKKYPELKLLIEKPADARVCEFCNGSGIVPGTNELDTGGIVCYCGGLGWVP